MSFDNGGPAFPTTPENEQRCNGAGGKGMTLRDYFAAKALGGMLADPSLSSVTTHSIALAAYDYADAMLAARKEPR